MNWIPEPPGTSSQGELNPARVHSVDSQHCHNLPLRPAESHFVRARSRPFLRIGASSSTTRIRLAMICPVVINRLRSLMRRHYASDYDRFMKSCRTYLQVIDFRGAEKKHMAHLFGYNRAHAFRQGNRYAHPSHLRLASRRTSTVKSREAEHQAFLDWLLETAQTHQVDAIIVLVMFSIPARRPVTPARYTTVLLSIYSKLAVIWWYWQETMTRSPR